MPGSNLLTRLIDQLDGLIPFIAIAHEDVFTLIQKEKHLWGTTRRQKGLPDRFEIYRVQVSHSAFLLGYSYFEAFLSDLARAIFLAKPKMLPKARELKFEDILRVPDYQSVIQLMVDKEIYGMFEAGVEKVAKYFQDKLKLKWADEERKQVVEASSIRNCIVHNLSRADARLSSLSSYEVGDTIELSPSEVHSFGIAGRKIARELFGQAESRYLGRTPRMPIGDK